MLKVLHAQRRARGQRGSAAVEFALVFPLFLFTLGMMMAIGGGMWARYQLTNYANNAARACAFTVPVSDGSVGACIPQVINQTIANREIPFCQTATPTVTFNQVSNDTRIHIVTVDLSCNIPWSSLLNVLPTFKINGNFTVVGRAAIPFLPTGS